MSDLLRPDEDLLQRLPLPLAQLCRRAHNAKADLERHQAAFYLWEAALKLLGAACVVEYARLGDGELDVCLHNLARPALGHWWEFVRRLTPRLADCGVTGFSSIRDLLTGRRDDLPRTAGLDAALRQTLDGAEPAARASVAVAELFDRLVHYRNAEIGHGAAGQRPGDFYGRMGRALLAGATEFFGRFDVLAGRRLLFAAEVRQVRGIWRVERFELVGESPRRLEPLDLPREQADTLPDGDRVYLEEADGALTALHPLLVYDAEANECALLNARRGSTRADFLCYSSGRMLMRPDLGGEQRALLARALRLERISPEQAEAWAALSQADEPADAADGSATPRTLGEYELLSELGRGGMGVVYRARQPALGRQVALKCLLRPGDPKAEARFRREIRALGRVDHPHLMKVFASGADGDQWFYVMELVEGASLAAICDKLTAGVATAIDLPAWQAAVSTAADEQRTGEKPLTESSVDNAPLAPFPLVGEGPAIAPSPLVGEGGGGGSRESKGCTPHPALPHKGGGSSFRAPEPETGSALRAEPVPNAPKHGDRAYIDCVVSLVRQAAEAAEALHRHGVVHRDVKPGNILVDAAGARATLMDLGLAQLADDVEGRLTRTRQFVGTLRYASPEQVLAVAPVDRRGDVYGLGATLWELLALRPLFGATEATPTPELMQTIQREEPQRLRSCHRGVSRDLEAIVHKCLEKKPTDRYATAQELADDLARYLAGEPVRARRVRGVERTWKWVRRRPVLAGLLAAVVLVTLAGISSFAWAYGQALTALDTAHDANRRRLLKQVDQLQTAAAPAVPGILQAIDEERTEALPFVRAAWEQESPRVDKQGHMRLALALLPEQPDLRDQVAAWMLEALDPREMLLIRDTLTPFAADMKDALWLRSGDKTATADGRFRAMVALAAFDSDNPRWKDATGPAVELLLRQPSVYLGDWRTALRPVAGFLAKPLGDVFRGKVQADKRQVAAEVLADYAADDVEALVDLAADADAEQFVLLVPLLQRHRERAAALLEKEVGRTLATGTAEADRVAQARRQASAAAALLRLGQPAQAWPVLRHTPTPDARSYLIRDLAPRGVTAGLLVQRLDEEQDVSARRALILALGEYTGEQLPAAVRGPLVQKLLGWYRSDSDAGIHGAIDWLLRHGKKGPMPRWLVWDEAAALAAIDAELKDKPPPNGQGWYVTQGGATMTVVRGPVEFTMGSSAGEAGRNLDETAHRRRIGRSFAVAVKAVTVGQWKEFLRCSPPGVPTNWGEQYSPEDACPINGVDWYTAAKYCRWLSEQEGVKESEMCYPDMVEIEPGMKPYADYLSRSGYRLPSEAEWEYTCRAGATTARCYGSDVDLLPRYGWFLKNCEDRMWPVGQKRPNDLGLFDLHGNAWTWVQDGYRAYGHDVGKATTEDKEDIRDIEDRLIRVLRGGGFDSHPSFVRSSFRISNVGPAYRSNYIGLRVARTYR